MLSALSLLLADGFVVRLFERSRSREGHFVMACAARLYVSKVPVP